MPSIMATLGLNAASFNAAAQSAQSAVTRLGNNIRSSLGAQVAGALSGAAITAGAAKMLELGGKVQDISNRLGISTDAVQKWDYALKQNGSSIEAAIPFFQKLSQARQKALEGNDKAVDSFAKLGVTMDMLKNGRVEDIAGTIAKAFETGDPQQLMAALVAVGGKGGGAMAAAFRDGLADALGEASVIPQKDIEALDRAADAIGQLKNEATSIFAPFVADAANFIMTMIDLAKVMIAMPVGAINGIVEAFQQVNFADIFSGKAVVKIGKGAIEGAMEGMSAITNQIAERDIAAKEKRERLKKGNTGAFDPEGIEDEDAIKLAEKLAKEREKAEREAERARKKADRDAEKATRAEAKLNNDVAKEADKQLKDDLGLTKRDGGSQFGFAGTFAMSAGPEMAAMNAQVRSEEHLRQLKEYFLKKRTSESPGEAPDVEY